MPPEPLALPTGRLRQRPPAYCAVKVGGRRAYALARAGEAVELAEREVEVTRFELLWREDDRAGVRDRVLVRAPTCARWSPTSATPTASSCGGRRSAPFDVDDADPERIAAARRRARASCRGDASPARGARKAVARRGGAPARREATVRLVDDDGLIALAEPREDGTLKPVVGFRG